MKLPDPGVCLTLWTSDDMRRVLTPAARALLAAARPQVVSIHAGPDRLASAARQVAADARAIVPGVRLWLCVGWEVWGERVARRQVAPAAAMARMLAAADLAVELGAEAFGHDAEAEQKLDPARLGALGRETVAAIRAKHPALPQFHTAYDHPTLHSRYPWAAWLATGGVDFAVPQVYCAPNQPKGGPTRVAGPGALERRRGSHRASWVAATRKGWIHPGLPTLPYHQLHHVPAEQTIAIGSESPTLALWAAPTRMDADGVTAVRALCELKRRGQTVREFQAAAGLVVDGVAGPRTLGALGIR